MRLSWSAWLALPFLFSSGCEGDNCGPTSEWPTCGTADGDNASSNDKDGEESGDGKTPPKDQGSGTKKDAGKASGSLDAGASTPVTADPDGNGEFGAGDAGDAGGDAHVPSFDGGLVEHCTVDSDGRDAGACFGVYCDVAQSVFRSVASDQGACLGAQDLALACDGELARVVAKCAQEDVLMLGFGRNVALCAARAPTLQTASEGCIACYVDEILCALQECLAPCFSGSSADCTTCRRDHCGAAFSSCAGLPD